MDKTTRVLIVEDEVLVAEDIKESLIDLGYCVTAAVETGEEAVIRAKADQPHVVLMDIILRGKMDGIEAAKKIRQQFGIPVVFLSSHSDIDTLERAKESEPYAFITKPFDDKDIQNAITIALYRKKLDDKLEIRSKQLEEKVARQNKDLAAANEKLEIQVSELTEVSTTLQEKTKQLEDANNALRYILRQREQDKVDQGERIMQNINNLILPHLAALQKSALNDSQQGYMELICNNIQEILTPFARHLTSKMVGLTATELKIADLVKNGKRSKEIADMLLIAPKTVEFHRENIRKKLGLLNKKMNLCSYLNSL